ncbi:MAG: DUF3726 domain-containing protein [Burkholderiaceae bacterium]
MNPDYSLGETESLVTRAGRGAGLSWGQAQDAGKAVVRLAVQGLPAADWFAALLPSIEATPYADRCPASVLEQGGVGIKRLWEASGSWLCPVAVGCSLADVVLLLGNQSNRSIIEVKAIRWPMLVAGFVLPVLARANCQVRLQFGQADVLVGHTGVFCEKVLVALSVSQVDELVVTVEPDAPSDAHPRNQSVYPSTPSRCELDPGSYQRLQAFALNATVPSTASSSMTGAGADQIDDN